MKTSAERSTRSTYKKWNLEKSFKCTSYHLLFIVLREHENETEKWKNELTSRIYTHLKFSVSCERKLKLNKRNYDIEHRTKQFDKWDNGRYKKGKTGSHFPSLDLRRIIRITFYVSAIFTLTNINPLFYYTRRKFEMRMHIFILFKLLNDDKKKTYPKMGLLSVNPPNLVVFDTPRKKKKIL